MAAPKSPIENQMCEMLSQIRQSFNDTAKARKSLDAVTSEEDRSLLEKAIGKVVKPVVRQQVLSMAKLVRTLKDSDMDTVFMYNMNGFDATRLAFEEEFTEFMEAHQQLVSAPARQAFKGLREMAKEAALILCAHYRTMVGQYAKEARAWEKDNEDLRKRLRVYEEAGETEDSL